MINRPDINNYIGEDGYFDHIMKEKYMTALNLYIDYLEKCLKDNQDYIDKLTCDSSDNEKKI